MDYYRESFLEFMWDITEDLPQGWKPTNDHDELSLGYKVSKEIYDWAVKNNCSLAFQYLRLKEIDNNLFFDMDFDISRLHLDAEFARIQIFYMNVAPEYCTYCGTHKGVACTYCPIIE